MTTLTVVLLLVALAFCLWAYGKYRVHQQHVQLEIELQKIRQQDYLEERSRRF
jgi:hypothetical protein